MRKLFGTDGIRGKVGVYPLDPETIGRLGAVLGEGGREVFVCWDTRESSSEIYGSLAAGIRAAGGQVVPGGVLPTPAAALLARRHGYGAAISISASHNPFEDNGIKVFGADGKKLPDEQELAIEHAIAQSSHRAGRAAEFAAGQTWHLGDYVDALRSILRPSRPLRLVIDCANGASTEAARLLFGPLGAEILNDSPDGRNINLGCGALHPEYLQQRVRAAGADLGVALDGDGDRAIFVDETGAIRDGDYTLFLQARDLLRLGALDGHLVVGTVMANMGLDVALADLGIELVKTPVGDRYVLAEMERRGAVLGGEQSGHTIRMDLLPAGDGLLTTIVVANLLASTPGATLSSLCAPMHKFPQVLLNIPVREKRDFRSLPVVHRSAARIEADLAGRGRLLLRYSGTEMLARVMIEGEDDEQIRGLAGELAAAIRDEIGAVP